MKKLLILLLLMCIPYVLADGNLSVSMNVISNTPTVDNESLSLSSIISTDAVTVTFTCNDADGLLDLSRCQVNLSGAYGENTLPNVSGTINTATGNCTVSIANNVTEAGDFNPIPVCFDLSELESTDGTELFGTRVNPFHSSESQLGTPTLNKTGWFDYVVYGSVRLNSTLSNWVLWRHTLNYTSRDTFGTINMTVWEGESCGSGAKINSSTTTNLYWTADVSVGKFDNETVCMNYTKGLRSTTDFFQIFSYTSNLSQQYVARNITVRNYGIKTNIAYNVTEKCMGDRLTWGSESCGNKSGTVDATPDKSNTSWKWLQDNLTETYSAWIENASYSHTVDSQKVYKTLNVTNNGGINFLNIPINTTSPIPGSCNLCNDATGITTSGYSEVPFWDEGDAINMSGDMSPTLFNTELNVTTSTQWYYWNMTLTFSTPSDINFTDVSYNYSMKGISGGFVAPCVANWNSTTFDIDETTEEDWICFKTASPKVVSWTYPTPVVGSYAELLTLDVNPTSSVNWTFVNDSYTNIRIRKTAGETHVTWTLYWYNDVYIDVTNDPTFAFEGSGTNITFLIPNVSRTRTASHLVYYKIEGQTPSGGGAGGGGGGDPSSPTVGCLNGVCEVGERLACPIQDLFKDCDGYCNYDDDPDHPFADELGSPDCPDFPILGNLTVIFEISPRTIDPVIGAKPAPLQAIGSVCRTYHIKNIGSAAGNVELFVAGEVYNVPGLGVATSTDWVTLNWNKSEYLLIGETKDVSICVSYPEGADSTYKAQVVGKSFGHTEFIEIFIQPPLMTQLIKFLLRPSSIIGIILLVLVGSGVAVWFVLKRK